MSGLLNPYWYGGTPFTDGLVSYWKFNGDANDSFGSNNGTATSVSYVSGLIDNCADFSASASAQISVPDSDTLSFGNGTTDSPFSIVTLVKFNVINNSWIVSKRTGATNREYQLVYFDSRTRMYLFDQSATAEKDGQNFFSMSTGTWYVITSTYNGTGFPTVYIDNNATNATASLGSYTAMENLGAPLLFGKANFSTALSLDGQINMTAIYNKALTASEVSAIVTKLKVDNEHLI